MSDRESLDLLNGQDHVDEETRLLDLLEACRLKASDEFEEPEYTIEQNGTGFAPKGNIMALMAEMKHGKTFVNTTIASAVLRGEFMGLRGLVENPKVIFFDTEQDKADGQRIQRRVQYINGWDFMDDDSHRDQFRIYHMREYPFDQRRELIEFAVRHFHPDVVFIDGIRDLLKDFNSLEESADLIQMLMKLSSECNTAIWTVLHVNPNSEKMRGHLGTELGNKVTDVFKVVKKKDKNSKLVTFEVEHVAARHRDVDGWEFKINDEMPYGIPQLLTEEDKKEQNEATENEMRELDELMKRYLLNSPSMKYTPLRNRIRADERIAQSTACKIVNKAIEYNIIIRHEDGRITYNGINKLDEQTDIFTENKEQLDF